jgi:hypothetical protein
LIVNNTQILQAYGLTSSILKVSEQLLALNVAHSIVTKNNLQVNERFLHLGLTQPAWPVLIDGLSCINKVQFKENVPLILFVCDSLASIEMCNIQQIKSEDLKLNLKKALIYAISNPINTKWKLTSKEPSIEEYVNAVSKPQILNEIQTSIYKITPYSLRKEVQALVISYLANDIQQPQLKAKLQSNYKLADILNICCTDKANNLRKAVVAFNKSKNIDLVSEEYGIASFQILYITRSFALTNKNT